MADVWRSRLMLSSGSRSLRLGRLAGGDSAAADAQPATVKMFGEMEFWFAMIKIVAIVSLIVVGGHGGDALSVTDWCGSVIRAFVE